MWNLPPFESQKSLVDAQNCVEESFCHIVFMLTGFRPSPRALGLLVGVTGSGSGIDECLLTVNKKGLMPYAMWPTPDVFNWQQYYAQISQPILEGLLPTKAEVIPFDLTKSPGWTILQFPSGIQHAVAQINENEYFDSEPGNSVKPLNYAGAVVLSQHGVKITADYFVKSSGFSPEMFANFSPQVQQAIKANDNGAKNIIVNGIIY